MSAVEEMAQRIVAQTGVTIERARAIARQNLPAEAMPLAPHLAPSVVAAQDGRREELQQNDIIKLWMTLGGKVWNTSAVTRAKITPGFADLYLTMPRWEFALWWETKSAEAVKKKDGGRSPEQMDFAAHVTAARADYDTGTFRDFVTWLITHLKPTERLYEVETAIDKAGLSGRLVSEGAE